MIRGEIRWYRFAKPGKKRPVLVLTPDSVMQYPDEATMAPITPTVRELPSEVTLSHIDGMPRDCAVDCDHIQTVPKARLGALITSLGATKLSAVRDSVAFALDL